MNKWLQLYKYRVAVEDELIGEVAAMVEELSSGKDASLMGINNITATSLQSEAGKIWERAVARFAKYGRQDDILLMTVWFKHY